MKKILNIAWKDLLVIWRDPTVILLLVATPFGLTLAMTFAFGTGGGGGLAQIPVAIVNYDDGQFGQMLVDVFHSEALDDLVAPRLERDEAAALDALDADETAAVLIIPADFSQSIAPDRLAAGQERLTSVVKLHTNPTRPISGGVVEGIVTAFLNQVAAGAAGGEVAVTQLLRSGLIQPEEAIVIGRQIGEITGRQAGESRLIRIQRETTGAEGETAGGFNWLAYMAPSMAILFLMFTVVEGGRSILIERDGGTLPRMLTTPTTARQVLAGKVAGVYLTGLTQMGVLIIAGALILGVRWGSAAGVVLLVMAIVAAAAGWGILIAAFARSSGQANAIGTALALVFGIGAGNFFPRAGLPEWLQTASLISPNAWGLEGFTVLAAGGGLADIWFHIAGLLIMALLLVAAATLSLQRQIG